MNYNKEKCMVFYFYYYFINWKSTEKISMGEISFHYFLFCQENMNFSALFFLKILVKDFERNWIILRLFCKIFLSIYLFKKLLRGHVI